MMLQRCQDRPGVSPLRLARASVACGGELPFWPQFSGRPVVFCHMARIGIAALCHFWRIGAGDEILAPAYNCGTELDALRHSGARVQFYRIDEHAQIDLDDLLARVTDRTRMVYVIHYFGWPQELTELAAWCRARDIKLVEDCALSLFSCSHSTPIGMAGDAAVFSFPKTLPVPDGGALVLRQLQASSPWPLQRPPARQIGRRAAGLARNWLVGRVHAAARSRRGRTPAVGPERLAVPDQLAISVPDMPASYYFSPQNADWGMSQITASLLRQTNAGQIVDRRRRNYLHLQHLLSDAAGVEPLYNMLPEGVCPLAYPLLVANRRQWVSHLRARGIVAIPWWEGHHRLFSWDKYTEAHDLKMSVLALPIHQDLDEKDMDYIAGHLICLCTMSGELAISQPNGWHAANVSRSS